ALARRAAVSERAMAPGCRAREEVRGLPIMPARERELGRDEVALGGDVVPVAEEARRVAREVLQVRVGGLELAGCDQRARERQARPREVVPRAGVAQGGERALGLSARDVERAVALEQDAARPALDRLAQHALGGAPVAGRARARREQHDRGYEVGRFAHEAAERLVSCRGLAERRRLAIAEGEPGALGVLAAAGLALHREPPPRGLHRFAEAPLRRERLRELPEKAGALGSDAGRLAERVGRRAGVAAEHRQVSEERQQPRVGPVLRARGLEDAARALDLAALLVRPRERERRVDVLGRPLDDADEQPRRALELARPQVAATFVAQARERVAAAAIAPRAPAQE